MPQFLCNKRSKWLNNFQNFLEEIFRCFNRFGINWLLVTWLDHFQIPRAEIVPYQFVSCHQRFGNFEFIKQFIDFDKLLVKFSIEPLYRFNGRFWLFHFQHFPRIYQTVGIPDFVREISSLFTLGSIKRQIVSCRRRNQDAHAHAIGTELLNQLNRIGRITQRFRHFSSQFIANNSGIINIFERQITHVFVSGDNHSCYPEKHDFGRCNQIVGRIIILYFFVSWSRQTIKNGNWP